MSQVEIHPQKRRKKGTMKRRPTSIQPMAQMSSPRTKYAADAYIRRHILVVLLAFSALQCNCMKDRSPNEAAVVLLAKAPEALDPRFTSSAVGQQLSHLIFAPLLAIGDDLMPAPYLAASFTMIDPRTYEIDLRPNLTFHDGSPLTASDVAFTFNTLGDPEVRSVHAGKFTNVRDVEVVTPLKLLFHLNEPSVSLGIDLCAIGIVPEECRGRTKECRKKLVGSGPFRVQEWNQAEEKIRFVRNPNFAPFPVTIPALKFRVVRNQTTRLLELMEDNADLIVGDMTPTAVDIARRSPALRVQTTAGLGYSYLAFNLRGEADSGTPEQQRTRRALADERVRRAMAHALDIETVMRTKLRGAARRATGMLPDGHWAKNDDIQPIRFDPQLAGEMLDAAGYRDRGPKNGGRFRVVINTTPQRLRKSIALLFQQYLEDVGIDVTLRVAEWSTLYQEIKKGNFEMFSAKWTPVIEPDLMHWVFHSENIPTLDHAGGNRGAFVDAELDGWLTAGRSVSDRDVRRPLYRQAEGRLATRLPYVSLWFEDLVAIHSKRLQGFKLKRTASLMSLARARLDESGGTSRE